MTAEKGKTDTDLEMAKLRSEIVRLSKEVKGQMGLYMKHVESGKQISIDGDKIYPLGSVFKMPLMVEVFRQADSGLISMDEKLKLEARNYCIGSGILQYLSPGLELTVRDLVTLLIIATDNTASEILWKRIGIQRVNMLIRELGLAKTSIYLPWREGFLLTMGMGPFKDKSVQEAARAWKGMSDIERMKDMLKALNDMLLAAKPYWASFGSDIAKDVLVSGDAAAGMIYNGFSAKARAEGANVEYVYPKEGHVVWMDNVVLLKDAPNRENALKFMNFLLDPENAAAVTNYAAYTSGVTGVEPFLDEAIKTSPENNPPAGITPGVFAQACDEETQKLYDAIWTNLKK